MSMHKEGKSSFLIVGILALILATGARYIFPDWSIFIIAPLVSFLIGVLLIFFRNPIRTITEFSDQIIFAPADGKVVAIEKTSESEYYKDDRIQVSIFMSPLNVHVNRNSISGEVAYQKYHKGKFLVAWHPKSSTENERNTVVIKNNSGSVMLRQIAGALARRIVCYAKKGDKVLQGQDLGFIKFGSRVDLFLPLDAIIHVSMDQKVIGNKTQIASFS